MAVKAKKMKCEGCGDEIAENEVTIYQGKTLCEDCCFDLMNPPKTCDPTAVSSTLTIRKQLGQTGTDGLSELQKRIYNLVLTKGRISREELVATLHLSALEFEREFAVLRHCELLRGFKEDGVVYFTKY
jgi:late competence protein required for DNA uptake (superfamily II DNA/RNA helicase)